MDLKTLKEKLADKLFIEGIETSIYNAAACNQSDCNFVLTDKYPNKARHSINAQQIDSLIKSGYTIDKKPHGDETMVYVSGW